ncbi:MAG: hypothetical protein A2719_02590 [Candidatus Ryanbacteria bacterium RIFCSPHIGHO2_01_FULL_45_22]|uniref:Uncharacterized protein n=1 Tax=Candidatus Ryanbacteria bacterium RIFCSPHIGHO2_01_FULL_45_22 TaxID=1802114 RepID=A0A1G2G1Q1_9BACT|nr:MAG: hypothetical protein A2719_02590 [Candidatus Ryanbacteria bacterium RIFCSPHIGHO2_01_FULL_45_22]
MFTPEEIAMIREAVEGPKLPRPQFGTWFQRAREGWNVESLILDMDAYCTGKMLERYTKLHALLHALATRETGNSKRRLLLAEALKKVFLLQQ